MNDDSVPVSGSLAEFHERLGGVPLDRIIMRPAPGTATEEDLIAAWEGSERRRCELIDGTLIERFGTLHGAVLVATLIRKVWEKAEEGDVGVVLPGSVPYRLRPGQIRCPSMSYVPWETFPGDELPDEKVSSFIPALAVDFLNRWVTQREIDRKRSEYFEAGVRLVWVIDPKNRTAKVHTSTTKFRELGPDGVLDGGRVLPGFKLALADLFAATKRRKKKSR